MSASALPLEVKARSAESIVVDILTLLKYLLDYLGELATVCSPVSAGLGL